MRKSDPNREFTWCLMVMDSEESDSTDVEFYETEREALSAAETAAGPGVTCYVARVFWQG